jgi:hypothetical protein
MGTHCRIHLFCKIEIGILLKNNNNPILLFSMPERAGTMPE